MSEQLEEHPDVVLNGEGMQNVMHSDAGRRTFQRVVGALSIVLATTFVIDRYTTEPQNVPIESVIDPQDVQPPLDFSVPLNSAVSTSLESPVLHTSSSSVESTPSSATPSTTTTTSETPLSTASDSTTTLDEVVVTTSQEVQSAFDIIDPAPPQSLTVFNKDGSPLLYVDIVPQAVDSDGVMRPSVAESTGDNRAIYDVDYSSPNTLPVIADNSWHQQDDNVYIYSHASNNPGRSTLAFQFLAQAEAGSTVQVQTEKGIFTYQIESVRSVLKVELDKDASLWTPNKGTLALITCVPNTEGVPKSQEHNTVVIARMIAAQATA